MTTTLTIVPPAGAELVAAFTVPGEPVSKARARFTGYGSKVRTYTPAKTMQAERAIAAHYRAVAEPNADPETAFGVVVEFHHETGQRRDVDNMLKAILDGLNKIAWPDDAQVTFIQGTKFRVPKGEARTVVTVYELGRIEKPRGRCVHCGTEFAQYASTAARKFCTRECNNDYRRQNRTRACLNCDEKFLASIGHDTRYCGRDCASAHKRVQLTCLHCNETFTLPRSLASKQKNPACSAECRSALDRARRKRSAPKGTCADCGSATSKPQYIRCRPCNYAAGGRWANKYVRKTEETP